MVITRGILRVFSPLHQTQMKNFHQSSCLKMFSYQITQSPLPLCFICLQSSSHSPKKNGEFLLILQDSAQMSLPGRGFLNLMGGAGHSLSVSTAHRGGTRLLPRYMGLSVLGWVSLPGCELRGRRSRLLSFRICIVQHLVQGRVSKGVRQTIP